MMIERNLQFCHFGYFDFLEILLNALADEIQLILVDENVMRNKLVRIEIHQRPCHALINSNTGKTNSKSQSCLLMYQTTNVCNVQVRQLDSAE